MQLAANMDANKWKKILEIVFEYYFRTIGSFVAIAAFWLYFTEQIGDRRFWIGLGAAVALGFFGPKANLNFFRKLPNKDNDEPADTGA